MLFKKLDKKMLMADTSGTGTGGTSTGTGNSTMAGPAQSNTGQYLAKTEWNPAQRYDGPKYVDAQDIQKHVFDVVGNENLNQYSVFLDLLDQFQTINGVNYNLRPGQQLNLTFDGQLFDVVSAADPAADQCAVSYETLKFAMENIRAGIVSTIAVKDCKVCNGNNCGKDAYDVALMFDNEYKANVSFAKYLDSVLFTGKDLKGAAVNRIGPDGQPQAVQSLIAQAKEVADADKSENYLNQLFMAIDEFEESSFQQNLLPRTASDAIVFVSPEMLRILKQTPTADFEMLNQGTLYPLPGVGFKGYIDSSIRVVKVPKALLGDIPFVLLDAKAFYGGVFCQGSMVMGQGTDVNNPFSKHYVKRWVWDLLPISIIGNYSLKGKKLATQETVVAYKTKAATTA